MRTVAFGAVVSLGLLLLGSGPAARAGEEEVPLKDVPRAVLDAVKARFPGAELKEAAKETEEGRTVYEVSLKHRGKGVDVSARPDGTIVEVETELATKDLPAAVAAAVKAKYPGAVVKRAEEIVAIDGGKETKNYEVLLTTGGKKSVEVKVSPGGQILEEEAGDEG